MTDWDDVLAKTWSTLTANGTDTDSINTILTFLQVLPEEITNGRKINLSVGRYFSVAAGGGEYHFLQNMALTLGVKENELLTRTKELLQDNANAVIQLLNQIAQQARRYRPSRQWFLTDILPAQSPKNDQFIRCIDAWVKEVPLNDITNTQLLATVFNALATEEAFDAAVDCLITLITETRDVDECLSTIQTLYPLIVGLRPRLAEAAEAEESETFKGIARVFCEAGEAWVLLVAREPLQYRGLIEAILEVCARDKDKEAIGYTFNTWYELKQYLTLERYIQARLQYVDVYSKLVDIMVEHLEFPKPESGNEDVFEGDRTQEEKFREFRHKMGDVLKDCCEVIGVTECLQKSYALIEKWVQDYGALATPNHVPEWQKLEAPLFSMRAMGRMIPADESIMLPRLIPLIVQIPNHEKIRFQAVMVLGRYTEWTAQHPETLQPQLQFIMDAFQYPSAEVVKAAALSFRFFCTDCADLLKDHNHQLQQFYSQVLARLPFMSQEELTEGVAEVLAKQPIEAIYDNLKMYCDPLVHILTDMARAANTKDEKYSTLR